MLAVSPDGSFTAAPDARTVIHRSNGRASRHDAIEARALSVCPEHAAVLARDGTIYTLAHERRDRWSIDAPAEGSPCAVSPCAAHVFNGAHLLSRSPRDGSIAKRELHTRDFFDRYTRADFVDGAHLALCYETGQPWTDNGSYGDRMKNVHVCRVSPSFDTVFYWWDTRQWDEDFAPSAIAYAPRAPQRFAIYDREELHVTEVRGTRINWEGLPEISDDSDERWIYTSAVSRLVFHREGLLFAARTNDTLSVFDVVNERRADLRLAHDAFDFHRTFLRWLDTDTLSIAHAALTELDWVGMYD